MAAEQLTAVPAVEFRGITKVFGAVRANDGVSMRVEKGTIHGVVGENGAGKSTAMKMLYGIYPPDGGQIIINGEPRSWNSPSDAIRAGIGMVHQHFMLARPYTALDNVLLGAEPAAGSWHLLPRMIRPINRSAARERLESIAQQYGLHVPWMTPVDKLPVGVQQRIEILKLLYREAQILILDEPTAVLTPQEVQQLFKNLQKLRDEGKTILIITHKLREVMSFTDRVTVLRAGKVTGEVETSKTSPQELADLMVGRKVVLNVEIPEQKRRESIALEVRGLTLRPSSDENSRHKLRDVNFQVHGGEIVGIAGVEGNGQSELLQALLHPSDPKCRTHGEIHVLGKNVTVSTAREIKDLGVGVIPEDRHREGLLLDRPLDDNYLLGFHCRAPFCRAGFISYRLLRESTVEALEKYDVRPRLVETEAGRLSGGNQQKLVIAREFDRSPKLLIAAQPTRGVDVGAIEFIHKRIIQARQDGVGVLLVSSELDEILTLSDRILVMYEGAIAAEFKRGECTESDLGLCMGGGAKA